MKSIFVTRFRALMRAKVGLVRQEEGDDDLIRSLLQLMAKTRADYTLDLSGPYPHRTRTGSSCSVVARQEALSWRARYRARMDGEGDAVGAMNAVNPKYVLRNWVAETAIRAVEDRGDSGAAGPHPDPDAKPLCRACGRRCAGPAARARIFGAFGLLLLLKARFCHAKNGWQDGGRTIMVRPPWNHSKSSTASPPP